MDYVKFDVCQGTATLRRVVVESGMEILVDLNSAVYEMIEYD